MNKPPLVSICIPSYNAGEFFEPCLQSALAQTYPNIEILISDDGSTDTTMAIAEKYSKQYSNIRIVRNTATGMVNNWNNSIEQAKGEWIKLLFQDDVLMPACIEKMLEACLAHNVQVGLCRRKFIIHDNVPKRIQNDFRYRMVLPERIFEGLVFVSPERLAEDLAQLLPVNVLGEPSCYFFNKKILQQAGMFDTNFLHAVDIEFILRLGLLQGLVFLEEPLAMFRVHGKSETSVNLDEAKQSQIRNIAATTGDTILLFHKILHEPIFHLLKKIIGEDVLLTRMNYLYLFECKTKGKKIVNKALEPIRSKYTQIGKMKYGHFNFMRYKKLYDVWQRENSW